MLLFRVQRFLMVLLSLVLFCSTVSSARITNSSQKLDPRLRRIVHQYERMGQISSTAVEVDTRNGAQPEIGVLIKARENPDQLIRSVGGQLGSAHGDIYTARLPLPALMTLAEENSIIYIEASSVLFPDLVTSVVKSGAKALHQLPGKTALTGKGVIVGITDTGIDWKHDDFKNADGSTRILYIWDQYLTGNRPPGFGYGAEFTSAQINAGNIPHRDISGHGTHVSGIAAGNGRSTNTYIGMAPEADIIMVRGNIVSPVKGGASSGGFLDGYAYIRAKAEALGKRHVINSSFGTTLGPHDGTTLYEQAINANVALGTIITNSAGNYAANRWHAEAILAPGDSVILRFSAPHDSLVEDDELQIDIWYSRNDRIVVQVASPNLGYQPKVEPYAFQFLDTKDGFISVSNDIDSPLNGDNEIFIQMDRTGSAKKIARGTWRIKLTAAPGNRLPDGGEIDAWTERDDNATFLNYIDMEETINYPSTADSIISVASYENQSENLSGFSSLGPRRDGVLKPDIAAIGGNVVAALSSYSDDEPFGDPFHTRMSGTSMSAPHVCGAIALMLQAAPSLKPWQVRKLLYQAARDDNATGVVPNVRWGRGKLDIYSAVLPLISNHVVAGTLADSATGTGVQSRIIFRITNAPIDTLADVVTNVAGEFQVQIPPGEYRVEIQPVVPYPTTTRTLIVEADSTQFSLALTPAQTILINDDPNQKYTQYYLEAMDSLGLSCAVHNQAKNGPLTPAQQLQISDQPLIWFTGDAESQVLTASEQAFLAGFLDQGGKLFLTGQNIAESLNGSDFLKDRLHVGFVENSNDFMLHGVNDHPVGNGLKTIITTGNVGANNQKSRDVLAADAQAQACVVFDTTKGNIAGVAVADPNNGSRLVFFGFGFEAVNVGSVPRPEFASRKLVLANVLNWLNGVTSVPIFENTSEAVPFQFALSDAYPNPFCASNGRSTVIRYQLPPGSESDQVTLKIYDLLGRQINILVDRPYQTGNFDIRWDGRDALGQISANGIYFYQLQAGKFQQTKKLIFIR